MLETNTRAHKRIQIHFLSDVLFVVASLNLKVPSVDLLSKNICSTVVVSDCMVYQEPRTWLVGFQSIVGIVRGGNCSLSGPLW